MGVRSAEIAVFVEKTPRAPNSNESAMVSTKAMMKMSGQRKNPQVKMLCRSNLKNTGARLGGRLIQPVGGGATPVRKESRRC